MTVKTIGPCEAFDVNQQLSGAQAAEFKSAGFEACFRYIPRTPSLIKGNLTAPEIAAILGANLALSVVQHVAEPGWMPSAALGSSYGDFAGIYASQIGIPKGANIWLDLEEVAAGATAEDVIQYCEAWFKEVESQDYVSGLYVGWNIRLNPEQLYANLSCKHYWKAYNADIPVATRGYQIVQSTQRTLNGIVFDPNTISADNLGDLPIFVTN